uniref:Uncharacterized protein n=1 Tax=Arundo donax TaxID=35708 RepID=A0A0A9AG47_ARUDO
MSGLDCVLRMLSPSPSFLANAALRQAICSLSSLTSPPSLFDLAAPSSTVATRSANFKVLMDSLTASGSGAMCININVFACPPRESCKN